MIMKMKTPLAKALDAMSCIPFAQNSYDISEDPRHSLTIAGVEAGTLYNPKVDVILEKSIPSSFGKGSETVLDPLYRSGREIHGENIGFKFSKNNIGGEVLEDVKRIMFPGREANAKLYKLAVYETGGHFDWHMDSTHSDKHHATLLVALNSSWEGGDLVLRRNGIETHVDLRPQNPTSSSIELQAVVFFTDTEHCVEPVKSRIRIVLQFDVELEKTQEGEDESKGNQDEDEETGKYDPWMDPLGEHYFYRMKIGGDAQATMDKATLEKVLGIIKELHKKGTREVAFALQHLYRRSSISGEYLKGSDATLYDALKASGEFDISLHPVIFREGSFDLDFDENIKDHYVYRCDVEVTESDDPPPSKKQKRDRPQAFHIPELSGIQQISRQDFVEYTGNEAMPAEYRYFGGGMFIRPKSESESSTK